MQNDDFCSQWAAYFQHNQDHLLDIPWQDECRLSPAEALAITRSVQVFQLGESSEGIHFQRLARQYAQMAADPLYVEANRLFIEEEHRHARDLGRFLQGQSSPLATFNWTDAIFRRVRQCAGLEFCISVLVTAELVAMVYYKALRDATGSPVLRRICEQILQDEVHHVLFQAGMLRRLRRSRSGWQCTMAACLHRAFMLVTLGVVWRGHGSVFKRAGYTPVRFAGEVMCELENAILVMKGEQRALTQRAEGVWSRLRVMPQPG